VKFDFYLGKAGIGKPIWGKFLVIFKICLGGYAKLDRNEVDTKEDAS